MNQTQTVAAPALDLLHAACDLLRTELLPQLPQPQRHDALMISHALGIVGREISMTWHLLEAEQRMLTRFVAQPSGAGDALPLDARVMGLRRRLAQGIRAGEYDAVQDELHQALGDWMRLRCSIDAPRAVA